jgi:transcriptional regulator with XRE-family HTH domain
MTPLDEVSRDALRVLAENVTYYRTKRGVSKTDAAKQSGISRGSFTKVELQQGVVDIRTIARMAAYFQVQPWMMLEPRWRRELRLRGGSQR